MAETSVMIQPMLAIALTGRIGSGKSSVANRLRERGAATIDADTIVHALYREDHALRSAFHDRFGGHVLTPTGIDRAALAEIVFADPRARTDLEALVHPRVHERAAAFLQRCRIDGFRVAVIEAVKIVESGGADQCDALWIVTCPEPHAITRLAARGMTSDEAVPRLRVQGTVASWIEQFQADSQRLGRPRHVVVLDNGGTLEETYAQVDATLVRGKRA